MPDHHRSVLIIRSNVKLHADYTIDMFVDFNRSRKAVSLSLENSRRSQGQPDDMRNRSAIFHYITASEVDSDPVYIVYLQKKSVVNHVHLIQQAKHLQVS